MVAGLEASSVITLRMTKLAVGGAAAAAEAQLMASEKVETALALQARALAGGLGATGLSQASGAVAHLRKKVRANRRRLGGR